MNQNIKHTLITLSLLLLLMAAGCGADSLPPEITPERTDNAAEEAKQYITIDNPAEGARLDAGQPIIVSGWGGALFEGSLVVQALDASGNQLALQPTIVQSPEAGTGGEGPWQVELYLTADGETSGKIVAFATSPKDGSIVARDEVSVSFFCKKNPAIPLENTVWQLTSLADGTLNAALATHQVTANFDPLESLISGSAGCNRYFSIFKLEGEQLTIPEAVASTRRMCAEPQAAIEKAFLSTLKQVTRYQINTDNALNLLDAQGNVLLVFEVDAYSITDSFTREELANAAYLSEWSDQGSVQLSNGEYRAAAAGSASELIVMLTNFAAFGDLDGDGQEEAAVILVTNAGGSGSFYDLAVVDKSGQALTNLAITQLGDRVQIRSMRIENGEISVNMLTQRPEDAMCCPTQPVINRYVYQSGALIQVSSETGE